MGKFVIRETAAGFHFVLKAGNGEIIATSETYTTKDDLQEGHREREEERPRRPRGGRRLATRRRAPCDRGRAGIPARVRRTATPLQRAPRKTRAAALRALVYELRHAPRRSGKALLGSKTARNT